VPLLKEGKQVDDPFVYTVGDETLPAEGGVIVDLERFQAERDALVARGAPLGVRLDSGQSPELIADDLPLLSVVALEFPAFTDGRAYSSARILRERFGFEGEVRAVGDVGLEQLHFMQRAGFDAFELVSESPEQDWRIAHADMDVWYQPTADGRPTATRLRKS
jgi:uncharacterized protein (DUF934 family)